MAETWVQSSARTLVLQALARVKKGRLTVTTKYGDDKGDAVTFGDESNLKSGPGVAVVFKNPQAWVRICQAFDLGLSEAYMAQEIECDNLVGLFTLYITNRDFLGSSGGNILYQLVPRLSHLLFSPINDTARARNHASFHYDTSNKHFSGFLSKDMIYSNALWSGDADEDLQSAQLRKVQNIIDKARLSKTHHLLDIGCGWGSIAIEAARQTGCQVTGLTLSAEQKLMAEERIKEAGLEDKITILLCDYRKAPKPEGGYDRIVSVEMVEHVGDKFINTFFECISSLLKPVGGLMVVQGITNIQSFNTVRPGVDTFIDRYIFPGGYLPSVNQLLTSVHNGSGGKLEVETVQSIGPHYIKTLQCWRQNFERNWEEIRADFVSKHQDAVENDIEAYRRQWMYYFQYCESGFAARILDNFVITAIRTPWPEIPSNVPH
ncbi:Tuberculostearic acid methyltransferase UfaA1 [Cladobotryum mycophilum]|uniref:Tuberculostearic acid methyltransferase UfaA1 n=1 Tax=Cladobotryum mycophilum TaxID=491253 RepID=A0ABR0SK56_9HYPO